MPNEVAVIQVRTGKGRWTTLDRVFRKEGEPWTKEQLEALRIETRVLTQPVGRKTAVASKNPSADPDDTPISEMEMVG